MRYSDHGITIPTIWRQASILQGLHDGSQKFLIKNFNQNTLEQSRVFCLLNFLLISGMVAAHFVILSETKNPLLYTVIPTEEACD